MSLAVELEMRPLGLSTVARRALDRAGLGAITERVLANERLSADDGLKLFESRDLAALGALANFDRERRHGDLTYFNRNLHINATNVCEASCIFCSFARLKTGDPGAYTMRIDEAVGKLKALRGLLVTEVHTVNGLNPDLPWSYYVDFLRALKAERPDLHIKGFTAVEVHYFAEKYGKTYTEVLTELRDAGLGSLPGGGAEIFPDGPARSCVRDKAGPRAGSTSTAPPTSSACTRTHDALRPDREARRPDRPPPPAPRAAGRDRRVPDVHPAGVPPRNNSRMDELPKPSGRDGPEDDGHQPADARQLPAHQGLLGRCSASRLARSRWRSGPTTSTARSTRRSTTRPAPRPRRRSPSPRSSR